MKIIVPIVLLLISWNSFSLELVFDRPLPFKDGVLTENTYFAQESATEFVGSFESNSGKYDVYETTLDDGFVIKSFLLPYACALNLYDESGSELTLGIFYGGGTCQSWSRAINKLEKNKSCLALFTYTHYLPNDGRVSSGHYLTKIEMDCSQN